MHARTHTPLQRHTHTHTYDGSTVSSLFRSLPAPLLSEFIPYKFGNVVTALCTARFRHILSRFLCILCHYTPYCFFLYIHFPSPTLTINSVVHIYNIYIVRLCLRLYTHTHFPLLIFLRSFHFYLIFLTLVRRLTCYSPFPLRSRVGTAHLPSLLQ